MSLFELLNIEAPLVLKHEDVFVLQPVFDLFFAFAGDRASLRVTILELNRESARLDRIVVTLEHDFLRLNTPKLLVVVCYVIL